MIFPDPSSVNGCGASDRKQIDEYFRIFTATASHSLAERFSLEGRTNYPGAAAADPKHP